MGKINQINEVSFSFLFSGLLISPFFLPIFYFLFHFSCLPFPSLPLYSTHSSLRCHPLCNNLPTPPLTPTSTTQRSMPSHTPSSISVFTHYTSNAALVVKDLAVKPRPCGARKADYIVTGSEQSPPITYLLYKADRHAASSADSRRGLLQR